LLQTGGLNDLIQHPRITQPVLTKTLTGGMA
jgi:hypothetical protein